MLSKSEAESDYSVSQIANLACAGDALENLCLHFIIALLDVLRNDLQSHFDCRRALVLQGNRFPDHR